MLYICLYSNKKIPSLLLWSILAIFLFSLRKKINSNKNNITAKKKKRQKKDFAAYYNKNKQQ